MGALTKLISACPDKRDKYVHEIISATNTSEINFYRTKFAENNF
jgi:hypothetical protein